MQKHLVTIQSNAVTGREARAQEEAHPEEFVGILVDTTRCIGCRSCEVACGKTWGLHVPDPENDGAMEHERTTSDDQYMIVNRYETDVGEVFVKKQCMHCHQPACAAACPSEAPVLLGFSNRQIYAQIESALCA